MQIGMKVSASSRLSGLVVALLDLISALSGCLSPFILEITVLEDDGCFHSNRVVKQTWKHKSKLRYQSLAQKIYEHKMLRFLNI